MKIRLVLAIETFARHRKFFWSDHKGPSINDLVELKLVKKTYITKKSGDVSDISFRNISGEPLNIDGRIFNHGDFIVPFDD